MRRISYFFEEFPEIENKLPTKKWITQCVKKENKEIIKIEFFFSTDTYLNKLNKKHLNHNTLTDVITLDYSTKKHIIGDIFISVDRITENSKHYQTTFKRELARVMIHGVLHLIGYKDKSIDEKIIMREKENEYLDQK